VVIDLAIDGEDEGSILVGQGLRAGICSGLALSDMSAVGSRIPMPTILNRSWQRTGIKMSAGLPGPLAASATHSCCSPSRFHLGEHVRARYPDHPVSHLLTPVRTPVPNAAFSTSIGVRDKFGDSNTYAFASFRAFGLNFLTSG